MTFEWRWIDKKRVVLIWGENGSNQMNVLGTKASTLKIWYFLSDQIQKMFQKADKDGDGEHKYLFQISQILFSNNWRDIEVGCMDWDWYVKMFSEGDLAQIFLAKMYV